MKKTIYLIILVLMIGSVFGLSDPINQSLTEFNNLTRSDNALDVAVELNNWLDGLLGIVILLSVGIISFAMAQYFTSDVGSSMIFSLFVLTILAVLLKTVELIPDSTVYFIVPLLFLALGYKVVKG